MKPHVKYASFDNYRCCNAQLMFKLRQEFTSDCQFITCLGDTELDACCTLLSQLDEARRVVCARIDELVES